METSFDSSLIKSKLPKIHGFVRDPDRSSVNDMLAQEI